MSPYSHALVAALTRSSSDVLYRRFMKDESDPLLTACVNALAGGVLLLGVLGVPSLHGIGPGSMALLLVANAFWAAQTYFYILSFRHNDVVISSLLECARFVLLWLAGLLIFGEAANAFDAAGVVLVCLSILFGADLRRAGWSKGTLASAASVVCGACALACDKALTGMLAPELVILAGFFLPGLFYLALFPRCLSGLPGVTRRQAGFLSASTVLMCCTAYNLIFAFARGELGVSMTIYQSYVVMSFVMGIVLLGERSNLRRRSLGCLICLTGIALVSLV